MFRISCSFPLATSDELKICLSTVIFRFEENLYAYITQMHLVKFMWKFAAVLSTKYYLQALERRRSRLEHAAALH
jgi:hypothetical protein